MKLLLIYLLLAIVACLGEICASATSSGTECNCGCLVEKPNGGGCKTCNQCKEAFRAFTLSLPKNRALAKQPQGLGLIEISKPPGGGGGSNNGGSGKPYSNNNGRGGGGTYSNNNGRGGGGTYYDNNGGGGGGTY
jgi:hypothetical protein